MLATVFVLFCRLQRLILHSCLAFLLFRIDFKANKNGTGQLFRPGTTTVPQNSERCSWKICAELYILLPFFLGDRKNVKLPREPNKHVQNVDFTNRIGTQLIRL